MFIFSVVRNIVLLAAMIIWLSACNSASGGSADGGSTTPLTSLALSVGTLTPAFDSKITDYSVTVPYSASSIQLTTGISASSDLTVSGVHASSNFHTIYLAVGTQVISLILTYGTTDHQQNITYRLHITREEPPTDLDINSIGIDSGTLSPAFDKDVTSYTATVPYSVSAVAFTPVAADTGAFLTVNGAAVTSGHASGAVALNVGANVISIVSSNGASGSQLETKTYTFTVTRTSPSTITTLSALTLSSGSLSPAFASGTTAYTASVGYTVDSLTVTATTTRSREDLRINGLTEVSGSPSTAIPLNVGSNIITLVTTAEDGVSTRSYNVTVTRAAASTDATFSLITASSGSLSPAFSAGGLAYTVSVPYATDSITLTGTLGFPGASFTLNGVSQISGVASDTQSLNQGDNVFSLVVLAEDGTTTKTYTVTVNRGAPSTNKNLGGLTILPGTLSPTFSGSTTQYTVLLSDAATDFVVTPTSADGTALIELSWNNGPYSANDSGVASQHLLPNVGTNTLDIRLTSQSGSTQTYSLTVIYDICGPGYYDPGNKTCAAAGLGYFSPASTDTRTACSNKPLHASYTSPTAESASCPWSCDAGYLTTDGVSCSSYPNATILSCNSNEVAVGIYGRSGAIVDKIGVRCATITNGVVSSVVRDGPSYGGTGGTAFSADCPSNSVAVEVDGDLASYSGVTRTGRVRYRCVNLDNDTLTAWSPSGTYWGTSSGMGALNFQCGSGANPYGTQMNGIIIDNAGGAAYVGPMLGITCR